MARSGHDALNGVLFNATAAAEAGPEISGSFLDGSAGTFEPYVLEGCLGQGGFGEAHLAHRRDQPGPQVVLKFPRVFVCDPARSRVAVQLLRHEADKLCKLRHPSIVSFIDFVDNSEHAFIVMTFAAGGSLAGKLRDSPARKLPVDEVARLLRDILQAFDYIHAKGVLHLDVT